MSEQKELVMESKFYSRCVTLANILVFHTLMPVRIHGLENLPAEAPYVLIANHNHALDPFVMACAMKTPQITFMAKKELSKNKLEERFLNGLHPIFVDRHNSDMEAMRASVKVLKTGHVLGIFPEGTRHHKGQMEELESGTSLLTMRARAKLVPVYFSSKLRWFRMNHIYFGKPIDYADLLEEGINAETCARLTERMTETYRQWQEKIPFKY